MTDDEELRSLYDLAKREAGEAACALDPALYREILTATMAKHYDGKTVGQFPACIRHCYRKAAERTGFATFEEWRDKL